MERYITGDNDFFNYELSKFNQSPFLHYETKHMLKRMLAKKREFKWQGGYPVLHQNWIVFKSLFLWKSFEETL
jgi:hypothetical protein